MFKTDSRFMRVLSKLCDMVLLSAIFLVSCVPVITIGAASTALYYTTVKVLRRGAGYVFREYVSAFRLNFKIATGIWIGFLLVGGLAVFNILFSRSYFQGDMAVLFIGVYIAISFFVLGLFLYVYPVLSRFYMDTGKLLKMSYLMVIRFLPYTVLFEVLFALSIAAALLCLYWPVVLIFFIPSGFVWLQSLCMEPILMRFAPKEPENQKEEDVEQGQEEFFWPEDTEKTKEELDWEKEEAKKPWFYRNE